MATTTEFCVLGPLVVRVDGVPVPVPAGKQRAVLAALLLGANRTVSLDELAETLWGEDLPLSARVSVQNYVMRLRKALGEGCGARISTGANGYVLRVEAGELDLHRFEELLGAAWTAARDERWQQAADDATAALALWRGDALADVASDVLAARETPRLAELRLQAQVTRLDAELHLGRHTEVIGELRQLTGAHPLREHLHALLMLALYRDGRQAEALAVYHIARRALLDELGTEPGSELQELNQRVLTADPALWAQDPTTDSAADSDAAVPRELPPLASHFTGRESELKRLTELLDRAADQAPGTVVISAIGGTAGVGKTALAVNWAHQVADRFPDGQLYVNLRGYDPQQPLSAADALAFFLGSLGVPGPEVPAEDEERAARYRSLLAGKRVLIVLDNASSAEQVRPLLPGSAGCMVLVTSRDMLAGLVARDGAVRLDLAMLSAAESLELLRALVGRRVDAEPAAAAALVALCAQLPLALRVAAELASARPTATLADLTSELASHERRLDVLDAVGDPRTAIRAVFSWSYRNLEPAVARAFRLLSLHPGSDLDVYALAGLTGATLAQARYVSDMLVRASLVEQAKDGRFALHDLLRAFGRDLVAEHDGEDESRAALTRLFDYYLSTAAKVMDVLFPGDSSHYRPRIPASPAPSPSTDDARAARAWLDAERANLVATATYAASHGWPEHAIGFSGTLFRYLDHGGHVLDAVSVYTAARQAAQETGDFGAEAAALVALGSVSRVRGRYQQAASYHEQALTLFRRTGDRIGQARTLNSLGLVANHLGEYTTAIQHYQQSLSLYRDAGDRNGQAVELNALGGIADQRGDSEQAVGYFRQALALFRETGYESGEAMALGNLGVMTGRLDSHQEAADYLLQALALFRKVGSRRGEALALGYLANVDRHLGRLPQAYDRQLQSLEICREIGDPAAEAEAHHSLGEVLLAAGRLADARAEYGVALRMASQIGHKQGQAYAHDGLAQYYHASGELSLASEHWRQALAHFTELGFPQAEQIRARLASLHEAPESQPGLVEGR